MSMKHTKGKQTKGKQKIEMKVVETYADRMITFSKRKSGIFKKMNEIITLCDVEAAFMVFSQAGKPYTFAHPSMEKVVGLLRHEPSSKDVTNTGALVEAYKRQRIEELMKKYVDLVEELEMEKENVKNLKGSRFEKKLDKMWWNIPSEGLSMEELKQRHQAFVELHDSLCAINIQRLGKDCDGSSSGHVERGHCGEGEAEA
ncbi:hypothetical protein EUTSA_v10022229mg [Eutrema salsugineum]|uniref:MADS-box domain-containing protein n=1 Tax=Eutrema salsugineum TaxID=72664 RepID=V4NSM7_EUTSA|nr:agamous-like MADS-box protein AGL62 [Eutrema salsugineum]ESQ49676.1 hypothetical protein EUTSA_v10022229mg [Eutrema salsugineum]